MKKILVVLTVLCMMAGIAEAATFGDWEYYLNYGVNTTATITKYIGSEENVIIPTELNGYTVSSIGGGYNYVFKDCNSVISVEIPEGITRIEENSFRSCANLRNVILPSTIETIGYNAFQECPSLENISLPEGLTKIENNAFYGCNSLTSISIPEGVTSIGSSAFSGCNNITSIEIPLSVESIGSGAFYGCGSLISISIPKGVTSIESSTFSGCSSLTGIEIPMGVTSIGSSAFYNCSELINLSIPQSVTSIGASSFWGCSSLIRLILPDGLLSIEGYTFYKCSSLEELYIPESVSNIGDSAFRECSNLTSVDIPEGVTSIGALAFENCSKLTGMIIPDGVTDIGSEMFYGCTKLTSVTLSEGVTSIGNQAFYNCKSLTDIEIPTTLKTMGFNVFNGCENLKSITLPDNMSSIGGYIGVLCICHVGSQTAQLLGAASPNEVFCDINYPGLYFSYDYDRDEKVITGLTLKDADETITTAQIPDGVTSIGANAFQDCSSLTTVTIPNSVTVIGRYAFGVCSSLTSIAIPEGVTSIEYGTFDRCSSLVSIDIPSTVTIIGDNAFNSCSKLLSVVIPDGVTSIGYQAFSGCSKLESVVLPEGIVSIGNHAFSSCKSLTEIEIPVSLKTMGYNVFYGCQNLKSITLPDDMTSIGSGDVGVVCYSHIGSRTAQLLSIAGTANRFCDENYPGLYFSYDYDQDEKVITGLTLKDADETIVTAQIPAEVTTIGNYAFSNCSNLTSVAIPNGVTSIEYDAFYGCSSLNSVLIPDSVTSIGSSAFHDCKNLTEVVLPKTLKQIGGNVFIGCTNLATYTLPDDITDVGNWIHEESKTTCYCSLGSPASYALSKGNSTFTDPAYDGMVLRYVYDTDTATFTGLELIRARESIEKGVIPDGVTVIGNSAFNGCNLLSSITIPESVKTINSSAFSNCAKLQSVTLPDHVTSIGYGILERDKTLYCSVDSETARALSAKDDDAMFMDPLYPDYWLSYKHEGDTITGLVLSRAATHLVTAVIPDFVTDIGDYAFRYCTKLQNVKLPNGLRTIGRSAFMTCEKLEEISIPDGVTSIGQYAFSSVGKIKAYLPTSVREIGEHAFMEIPQRTTIYCYQYSYAQSWGNQNNVTVVLLDGKDFKSAGGTVSMPQTLYVGNGRSKTIAAEIFPKMSGLNITWKSSNTDVATVSSQGVLTAKKNGKTTVTLSVDGITARSAVTVVTPAEDFTIPADVFVEAGKATDAPAPVVYPSNAKLDLTWEVADTVIAEVSGDGKITSHVVGETTITATDSVTGLRRSATLHTIRPVTSIVLQPATLTLLPYQGAQLSAIVSADAFQFENQLVTFTSSNKKVATVDENGWVQAKGAGTAIITAVSENNIRATSQVTVSKATVLKLPSALRTIQANAFSGVAAEVVVLPAGVESIGDGAFANLSGLKMVVVPEAAAQAAKDAFAGTQAVLVRPDGREIDPQ